MNRTLVVTSIAFMMVMGLGVPGCPWFASHDDEGRICASPIEGGDHCVRASYGALVAWNEAAAHGSEPIQMWVEWPESVDVTQLVVNPQLMNPWLDNVQKVTDYQSVTLGNAESYYASLSGKLGAKLRGVRQLQENILYAEAAIPKERLKKLLLDKAANEADPLKAEVVADKQSMGDVLAIVEQAKVDGA